MPQVYTMIYWLSWRGLLVFFWQSKLARLNDQSVARHYASCALAQGWVRTNWAGMLEYALILRYVPVVDNAATYSGVGTYQ